jgi:hypothetical protein
MAPILPRPGNVQPLGLTDRVLVPHGSRICATTPGCSVATGAVGTCALIPAPANSASMAFAISSRSLADFGAAPSAPSIQVSGHAREDLINLLGRRRGIDMNLDVDVNGWGRVSRGRCRRWRRSLLWAFDGGSLGSPPTAAVVTGAGFPWRGRLARA